MTVLASLSQVLQWKARRKSKQQQCSGTVSGKCCSAPAWSRPSAFSPSRTCPSTREDLDDATDYVMTQNIGVVITSAQDSDVSTAKVTIGINKYSTTLHKKDASLIRTARKSRRYLLKSSGKIQQAKTPQEIKTSSALNLSSCCSMSLPAALIFDSMNTTRGAAGSPPLLEPNERNRRGHSR